MRTTTAIICASATTVAFLTMMPSHGNIRRLTCNSVFSCPPAPAPSPSETSGGDQGSFGALPSSQSNGSTSNTQQQDNGRNPFGDSSTAVTSNTQQQDNGRNPFGDSTAQQQSSGNSNRDPFGAPSNNPGNGNTSPSGSPFGNLKPNQQTNQETRSPFMMRLAISRESLRMRRNKYRFQQIIDGRGYTHEYSFERYQVRRARRGLGGSSIGESDGAIVNAKADRRTRMRDIFDSMSFTKVQTSNGEVSSNEYHVIDLFDEIRLLLQDAKENPTLLGRYRLAYSRRFSLPRYIYIEYNGMATEISARWLRIADDDQASSPNQ